MPLRCNALTLPVEEAEALARKGPAQGHFLGCETVQVQKATLLGQSIGQG